MTSNRPTRLHISYGIGTKSFAGRVYATAHNATGIYIETGFYRTREDAIAELRAVVAEDIDLVEPDEHEHAQSAAHAIADTQPDTQTGGHDG